MLMEILHQKEIGNVFTVDYKVARNVILKKECGILF